MSGMGNREDIGEECSWTLRSSISLGAWRGRGGGGKGSDVEIR